LELICLAVPTPTTTPTVPASPTATATLTATASPSATATQTSTPTPGPIYLPYGEKDKYCRPDAYRTDVVLVLDRSTSMLRPSVPGGPPKNAASIEAARDFIRQLDFRPDVLGRHDQVAVVGFNDLAWIEQPLTRDIQAAMAALDRIENKTQQGTRLDLAFLWGQKPLDGPERKPENRPVIIMLTDGLPNRVPFGPGSPWPGSQRQEDSVLAAVESVKLAGTRVYTIGLGSPRDILPWLLIESASEPWMYYYAPGGEDLAGIYAQIAATFDSCDPRPAPTPCVPTEQHVDVVLVLDLSTSMMRPTRTGRSKYAAAIAASRIFVDQLELEPDGWGRRDQVAIVGFNDRAWTEIGLSDERSEVQAAIDRLSSKLAEGTRLDLALDEGQRALGRGPRLQPNQPVVILMTDGLPNRVPFGPGSAQPDCPHQECTVLRHAAALKAAGTRLYTIGLGEASDVLRELLEAAASAPDHYYFAPDGEDLEAIYRQIAGRIDVCD
jgi:Mg-chelatase subunit ChlD